MEEIQQEIYEKALAFRDEHTVRLPPGDRLVDALDPGDGVLRFVRASWCGSAACEAKVKDETRATIRCIEFDAPREAGTCLVCGEATEQLTFERFLVTLKKNRDTLMARYDCKRVKFQVYEKDGKASLKATPIKS